MDNILKKVSSCLGTAKGCNFITFPLPPPLAGKFLLKTLLGILSTIVISSDKGLHLDCVGTVVLMLVKYTEEAS